MKPEKQILEAETDLDITEYLDPVFEEENDDSKKNKSNLIFDIYYKCFTVALVTFAVTCILNVMSVAGSVMFAKDFTFGNKLIFSMIISGSISLMLFVAAPVLKLVHTSKDQNSIDTVEEITNPETESIEQSAPETELTLEQSQGLQIEEINETTTPEESTQQSNPDEKTIPTELTDATASKSEQSKGIQMEEIKLEGISNTLASENHSNLSTPNNKQDKENNETNKKSNLSDKSNSSDNEVPTKLTEATATACVAEQSRNR